MTEDQKTTSCIRTKKVFGIFPLISLIGIVIGLVGGYAYYYFIGCQSGSCGITSNPWLSLLWGAALGYLLFDMFYKRKEKDKESENETAE